MLALYSTILYYAILYYTTLYDTIAYHTMLHPTVLLRYTARGSLPGAGTAGAASPANDNHSIYVL